MNCHNGLETERKYLIEYPDIKYLSSLNNVKILKIEQAYIKGDNGLRIRKLSENGKTVFIKTEKHKLSELTRSEKEEEISESEYLTLLERKENSVIKKTRYVYTKDEINYEIDVFPFWNDRAFLETELSSETEEVEIPDFIKIIKEVSFDNRYTNRALSKEIVTEDLKNI